MSRPVILDLFCGAGGAAMGYHRAGFDVIGVDNKPQRHYPFQFIQADALDVLDSLIADGPILPGIFFSAVHASPPCQAYGTAGGLRKQNETMTGKTYEHPELIEPTRDRLSRLGLPYVIENVPRSPLRAPAILDGTMFPGLRVVRRRWFETSFLLITPPPGPAPKVYHTGGAHRRNPAPPDPWTCFLGVYGNTGAGVDASKDAMGVDWPCTMRELVQMIPPPYTEFIGKHLIKNLDDRA